MSGIDRPHQVDTRQSRHIAAYRSPSRFADPSDAKLSAILASLRHALTASAPRSDEQASPRDIAAPAAIGVRGAVTGKHAGLSQNF